MARRWEGGCGKFVLIQSGGGDCSHRYIGGMAALPSYLSTAAKQQMKPSKCRKELLVRVMARARGPAGPWRAPELVVAARHHTGGFRAAPPVATRQRHWRRWRKGPEPSQWLLGSPITRTAAGQKKDLRRLLHTAAKIVLDSLPPLSKPVGWFEAERKQALRQLLAGIGRRVPLL